MKLLNEKVNYCLNCKTKPCNEKGCPLKNDIPGFINAIKNNNLKKAYKILSQTTVLPGICGRVCPHTKQCEGSCVRGIKGNPVSIGELEAFVFDTAVKNSYSLRDCYESYIKDVSDINSKKVAIIGGGPSGLTCAAFLAKEGIDVTIYERYNYLGGLLMYGIPDFRLPKHVVKNTVDRILELGVKVQYNRELGKNLAISDLEQKYDAIFLSFGANVSTLMGVEGEQLEGVYGGNELLEYSNHPNYEGKTVLIVGGGNVAIDCARTVNRLGAESVKIVYRRAEKQMPAETKEIEDAKSEGIEFLFQNNIVKIIGDGKVEKLELIKTKLVKRDGEQREYPVNVENSNYILSADYVIMALGSRASDIVCDLDLVLTTKGNILIDSNYKTSNKKIYAGGDIAGINSTVAWAANSGKEAAKSILKDIKKESC